jgi:hypothetical protein
VTAEEVVVPEIEAIELCAIGRVQGGELAVEVVGVEQSGLELADRREQRIGEAAEAGGAPEPVQ